MAYLHGRGEMQGRFGLLLEMLSEIDGFDSGNVVCDTFLVVLAVYKAHFENRPSSRELDSLRHKCRELQLADAQRLRVFHEGAFFPDVDAVLRQAGRPSTAATRRATATRLENMLATSIVGVFLGLCLPETSCSFEEAYSSGDARTRATLRSMRVLPASFCGCVDEDAAFSHWQLLDGDMQLGIY